MKKIVWIQIKAHPNTVSSLELEALGLEIRRAVEALGAQCIPTAADSTLALKIEGLPPSTVQGLLKPFVESVVKRRMRLSIVQLGFPLEFLTLRQSWVNN
jgi:hypothetical protein